MPPKRKTVSKTARLVKTKVQNNVVADKEEIVETTTTTTTTTTETTETPATTSTATSTKRKHADMEVNEEEEKEQLPEEITPSPPSTSSTLSSRMAKLKELKRRRVCINDSLEGRKKKKILNYLPTLLHFFRLPKSNKAIVVIVTWNFKEQRRIQS